LRKLAGIDVSLKVAATLTESIVITAASPYQNSSVSASSLIIEEVEERRGAVVAVGHGAHRQCHDVSIYNIVL
jgi:hypothetical protein